MRSLLWIFIVSMLLPLCTVAQLQNQDGTRLYVKEIGAGEPIVIVHGGPGLNHTYLLPALENLAKNHRLVFYDQRACGQSAIPSPDSISLKLFADDIETIRTKLGVKKLTLLAHSWGAIPAVKYAALYPDKVARMILVNPVALSNEYDAQALATARQRSTRQDTTDRAAVLSSNAFKNRDPQAIKKLILLSFRHSFFKPENIEKLQIEIPPTFFAASAALGQGLGAELSDYNFYPLLKQFSFPVLILTGKADPTPIAAITRIKENIATSELKVFDQSGHFIFIEEPLKFEETVNSFLKQVP